MRTYVLGRSPHADIVLADPSVARRHAELVVTDDGRMFLTDCGSDNGSWFADGIDHGGEAPPDWLPLRQSFVAPGQALRLGECHCNARQLLELAGAEASGNHGGEFGPRNELAEMPRGAVERDPHTGEIIRRRR